MLQSRGSALEAPNAQEHIKADPDDPSFLLMALMALMSYNTLENW
jgi:hypothetical protein